MQKTLGGDRLGSGKKMKVELHGYERSTHDLGYLWRSTMSSGTLVPFLCEIALPGDTFDIELDCNIKTHPTIGPLFGSYKAQLDVFQAPIRLYHSALHNNALNIGRNMATIKLPVISMTAAVIADPDIVEDIDNAQINPSSLLAYLGIRGIGIAPIDVRTRSFNAIPILAYWEIYKNYYANKQEEIGVVVHTPNTANVTTIDNIQIESSAGTGILAFNSPGTPRPLINPTRLEINFTGAQPIPSQIIVHTSLHGLQSMENLGINWALESAGVLVSTYNHATYGTQAADYWKYAGIQNGFNGAPGITPFTLSYIDDMRIALLASAPTAIFQINSLDQFPYKYLYGSTNSIPNILNTQEGLGLKTYQSDLFNNWLSTEWIDGPGGITEITAISTAGDSFTLDTLNLSKKVYNMLNRIAVSGGSYDDWLDAVYAHDRYQRCESPMYMGGLIKELVFQEVVSNSGEIGDEGTQPLGTLAGKGVMAKKHKGGNITIKVDEPSYILGIISLTPRIDYSQGNKWDVHLATMDDLHKPALDQIGFQELITEQMAWWDTQFNNTTNAWEQKSAGKQPAWINYMTNVNKCYGNFAVSTNEMFMTLNRRYEQSEGILTDLTTYIDPNKFNFIFANTALDAQNFWTQIAVDMTVRRKMSAKIMPNL